jgi:hypothetical protein
VRRILKWAAVPVLVLGVLTVATLARRGEAPALNPDLASDLELVASSTLELAPIVGGATVVSDAEIERPAARRTPTPTRRRGTKAPPPKVVAVSDAGEQGVDVAQTVVPAVTVPQGELVIPSPEATAPPAVPRPHPVGPRFPAGREPVVGAGEEPTSGVPVTVVIRGGRSGRDDCAIHDRTRGAGVHIAINQRIPGTSLPGNTTYPGGRYSFPRR